jgi:hypothetical protein
MTASLSIDGIDSIADITDIADIATALPAIERRPVRLRAAPRREPPFDDELGDSDPRRPLRLAGVGERPLPFDQWPVIDGGDRRRPSHPVAAAWPLGRGELPDPGRWARRLLVAVLETRVGQRPLRQLSGYLSPSVQAGLMTSLARVPAPAAGHRQATVTSVHACVPAAGVAEISAVVFTGTRYRAIAVRLEEVDERWRCVRLQLG